MYPDLNSTLNIETVDDLLDFLYRLHETYASETERSLEQYLRALWKLILEQKDRNITHAEIGKMFLDAFVEEPFPFDQNWLDSSSPPEKFKQVDEFEYLEQLILYQIADLHLMADAEMFEQSSIQKWMGFDSPSGHRWYNLHPSTYLECAVSGIRDHISLYIKGKNTPVGRDPHSTNCSWGTVSEILWFGQNYE